jgi:phosphatidate cytidylyltransferase
VSDPQAIPTREVQTDPPGAIHPQPPTPSVPKTPKKHSDLARRLFSAALLVPAVIYLILLGGIPYLVTVVVIVLLGQREFYRLIEDKGAQPLVSYGLVAGAALPVVAYVGNEYHATLLMTATLLAVMVRQLGKQQIKDSLASISGTFFGVFYVGWLFSHTVVLRQFHDSVIARFGRGAVLELGIAEQSGIFFVIYTLTVVIWCDTGAYFAGRAYGKRKLAPKISPGKSIEGAIGGVIAGTLAGLIAKGLFDAFWPSLSQALGWGAALVFGLLISLVGIVGDLVESLLKRDAAVKDTGTLLPGFGGVLDRIDAPLLAIPVMYYLLLFYVFLRLGPA